MPLYCILKGNSRLLFYVKSSTFSIEQRLRTLASTETAGSGLATERKETRRQINFAMESDLLLNRQNPDNSLKSFPPCYSVTSTTLP